MTAKDKLLYLLKLWNGTNTDVPATSFAISEKDWQEVFGLAKEQAVAGACLYSIELLPTEYRPPKQTLLQWIAVAEQVKWQNKKVDAALATLVEELKGIGVEPIIVKGQVAAQEYAQPELRQSGDIDVFVIAEQWMRLEKWLNGNGYQTTSHSAEKHIEINYMGVTVELHYHLNVFSSKKANTYWRGNIEESAMEMSRTVKVGKGDVRTLGETESLVHLLVHSHHHLLTEGIGLKQFIDIMLFLSNHFDELDLNKLRCHLHGIGHYNAFTAYCALMNKYLGLQKKKIPFELDLKDYVYADKIMREVWRGGNFGHKNNLRGVKPGLLHSMNTATLVFRHAFMFHRLSPAEACGYWWNKIFWRMRRKK